MTAVAQPPDSVKRFPAPTFHHLLVEPLEEGTDGWKRSGGLLVPDGSNNKPSEGRIVVCGPGRRNNEGVRIPVDFKAGQRIVFNRYSGTEVSYEGKNYLIIPEDEVKAVFP